VTVRVGEDIRSKGRGAKLFPSLSGNGRYVAFDALDGNLAPNKGTGDLLIPRESHSQVYVWDRVTRRTELVSRDAAGYAAAGTSTLAGRVGTKISRDGRWITFESNATNIGGGPDRGTGTFGQPQVWLRDRTGNRTMRVTSNAAGLPANGESVDPCISPDGRAITYASAASDLGDVDLTPGYVRLLPTGTDIYRYDVASGAHRIVSRSTDGVPGDLNSELACPSDGGKTVAFVSAATTLVQGDTNDTTDLFVHRAN
jgi:Tol biopolymer transport system component